jgi:3-oxosteroid 1-dehydrogenase
MAPRRLRPALYSELPSTDCMMVNSSDGDETCDVVVAGSGSAGLVAALRTSEAGLSTVVLERTDLLGGTTALSAAGIWIPANHHAAAAGIGDDRERALAYIRALAPAGWRETEDALWRSFVEEAPNMLSFLERNTPLRFSLTDQPDPFPDACGGRQKGRMVSPGALRRRLAGPFASVLRPPTLTHLFTYQEALSLDPGRHPVRSVLRKLPAIMVRYLTGARGMGTALVTGLVRGCLDQGCSIRINARAIRPVIENNRVTGLVVEQNGRRRTIRARRGVILATGGFEWDSERLTKHFPGPTDFVGSPPGNDGDAHRIAGEAGAQFAHMDQANITGGIPLSPDRLPFGISHYFHQEANAIIVNRHGRRFVNEYRFNLGEVIDERDLATGQAMHLPAWLVSDAEFLKNSPIVRYFAARNPGWLIKRDDPAALADAISVSAVELKETLERFNDFCRRGVDEDFHRHELGSRKMSIGGSGQNRLKPIRKPPYLAIPFNRTILSTKGGPRTDAGGRVLRPDGSVIHGLYCAGVAMANPIGTWAVGAGTTLGPNMTWGYICAKSIVDAPEQ